MSDVLDEGHFFSKNLETTQSSGDSSKVVTARGTEDGLVLRIDGKAEWTSIISEIEAFLGGRKKFFEGGVISLEWMDRLPTQEQTHSLEQLLFSSYGINIVHPKKVFAKILESKEQLVIKSSAAITPDLQEEEISLESQFVSGILNSGILNSGILNSGERNSEIKPEAVFDFSASKSAKETSRNYIERISDVFAEDIYYEDSANARVIYGTLRSGQRIESPFNLIVVGDVNPGADLVAGGDIVVFGSLRGTAHASAYDDTCFDRVIIALQMRPTQLRIGSVISRGSDEAVGGAEIARIESRRIIVESFNPRSFKRSKY